MRSWSARLLGAALLFAPVRGDALPDALKTRLDVITVEDLKRHETFLTSEECAGRDTCQVGLTKARDYLVEQENQNGLEGAGPDGSFLFDYDVPAVTWSEDDFLEVEIKGASGAQTSRFKPGEDFVPVRGSASGTVEGEVAFCGYGIVDSSEKYDDFHGVDVKGKVVLVLMHEPREGKKGQAFKGEEWTDGGRIDRKFAAAEEKGAKAVVVFTDPLNHKDLSVLRCEYPRYGSLHERPQSPKIPVVHASAAIADVLVGRGRLLEWQQELDRRLAGSPKKIPDARVRLKVGLHNDDFKVQDVVACRRGTDPKLADEWIVIGAHYDHLGVDEVGRIYHGADDNGSGTSCLLEVGRVLGAKDVTFKRSILIIHFSGEEKGLLGSTAYCKKPLVPASQTIAMLNMDMVGRGRPHDVDAAGLSYSSDFQVLVRKATSLSRARMKVGEGGLQFWERSDQLEFSRAGIPALFFMEPVEHVDYHKVTDTMDKIVYPKVADVGRIVATLAWLLSEGSGRPRTDKAPSAAGAKGGK